MFLNSLADDVRSPVSHVSLVMSSKPRHIYYDFARLDRHAPSLRHLRLSAPLAQLTDAMPLIPKYVRTLVLVVDNIAVCQTRLPLPPREAIPWERLHLGIRQAKLRPTSHLERVQFLHSALAERIRSELAMHGDMRRQIADIGVKILDDKNEAL